MASSEAPAAAAMEIEESGAPPATSAAPPRPLFAALTAHEMSDGQVQFRKVLVPEHRFSPLKKHWMEIYTPVYEQMKIDIRMSLKSCFQNYKPNVAFQWSNKHASGVINMPEADVTLTSSYQ